MKPHKIDIYSYAVSEHNEGDPYDNIRILDQNAGGVGPRSGEAGYGDRMYAPSQEFRGIDNIM